MVEISAGNVLGTTVEYAELGTDLYGGICPIGTILSWLKTFTSTPSLPTGWVECDGSVLSDADSVYNGETLPNLNGNNQFTRGNTTSGGTGGSSTHNHQLSTSTSGTELYETGGSADVGLRSGTGGVRQYTTSTSTLPSYYDVVWIMRVK